jgi:hypothetical protein
VLATAASMLSDQPNDKAQPADKAK